MKKRICFSISFIFLFIILINHVLALCTSQDPCCCQTYPESGQKRCYNSGVCCDVGSPDEFWDPETCYNFNLTVSRPKVFRVGQETPITLYLKNTGAYTDNYYLSNTTSSPNPQLIILEFSVDEVSDVAPGETRLLNPKITCLSATATGDINFTARSESYPLRERSALFSIIECGLPLSLPEFNDILILAIILSSTLIYYFKKKLY